jgi:hypothetical protein
MRPTFKKLQVKDIGNLERLVAENAEGIEPGLKVVDSRLLLGQAAIDLVGLDARGSLALIALDFTAHEGLLLRVMDAYSWCLEYPDTLRRLYPMAQVSTSRPPRILFIAERLTDSFLRRIRQLSFLEIDCLEFRHLEINGESVVYFDHVERLRKSVVDSPVEAASPSAVASVAPQVVEPVRPLAARPQSVGAIEDEPVPVERPAQTSSVVVESASAVSVLPDDNVAQPVVAAAEPLVVGKPAVAALIVGAESPVVTKPAAATEPVVVEEPVIAEQPVAVAEPLVALAEPAPVPSTLRLQAIEATASLVALDSTPSSPGAETHSDAAKSIAANTNLITPATPVVEAEPTAPTIAVPAARQPMSPAPVQMPVWAKPQAQPNGNRPYFFAQATKGASPVEAPAAAVSAPVAETSAPVQPGATKTAVEVDDRPELESLSFPKDGLSRQWLEFLSQLGATK